MIPKFGFALLLTRPLTHIKRTGVRHRLIRVRQLSRVIGIVAALGVRAFPLSV